METGKSRMRSGEDITTPPRKKQRTLEVSPVKATDNLLHGGQHDAAEERWYAQISTQTVGIRHYQGRLSSGCTIKLKKGLGVGVYNVANRQCGNLPKEFTPIFMDLLQAPNVTVEGEVASGKKAIDSFKAQVVFQIFGTPDSSAKSVPKEQKRLGHDRVSAQIEPLLERFRKCVAQYATIGVDSVPGGIKVVTLDKEEWKRRFPQRPVPSQFDFSSVSAISSVAAPWILEKELDKLYETQLSYNDMPDINDINAAGEPLLHGGFRLLPHQRKGLWFMVEKEKSEHVHKALDANSIWEKIGAKYENAITHAVVDELPPVPRGGILADEMGLGKTFIVAALLAYSGQKTLIVAPLSVLPHWEETLAACLPSVSLVVYHGKDKKFHTADIVVTTYQTLVQAEALLSTDWHRVILDEAHLIRNANSKISKTILEQIKAKCRWCLTATPFVNRLEDLYPVARFLDLHPLDDRDIFHRFILRPFKQKNSAGIERLNLLLRTLLLRRLKSTEVSREEIGAAGTRVTVGPLLELPPVDRVIVKVPLTTEHQHLYDRLYDFCEREIHQCMSGEGEEYSGKESSAIVMITRLRQMCQTPALFPAAFLDAVRSENKNDLRQFIVVGNTKKTSLEIFVDKAEDECSVCLALFSEAADEVVLSEACGHIFHRKCLCDWLERQRGSNCPECRKQLKLDDLIPRPVDFEELAAKEAEARDSSITADSSKCKIVAAKIMHTIDIAQKTDGSIVIFSSFVSVLREIERAFQGIEGMETAMLIGSMPLAERKHVVQRFQTPGSPHMVLLCSLKVAGVGITLTRARAVILMDPWWNSAMEDQAIGRVHRIGFSHDVLNVYHLIAENSIEERMMLLQDRKKTVMDGATNTNLSKAEIRSKQHDSLIIDLFSPAYAGKRDTAAPWIRTTKQA